MASTLRLEQRQKQVMAARLQQAVRLLQLSSLDFSQELQQTLSTNPFLEMVDETLFPGEAVDPSALLAAENNNQDGLSNRYDDSESAADGHHSIGDGGGAVKEESIEGLRQHDRSRREDERDWTEQVTRSYEEGREAPAIYNLPSNAGKQTATSGAGGDFDALTLVQEKESLQSHLRKQLLMQRLSPRQQLVAAFIVDALDDDGYLRMTIEVLHNDLHAVCTAEEVWPEIERREVEKALQVVQALEPVGVGARTVEECLLLQLNSLPVSSVQQLALSIVNRHFGALVKRDIPSLARALSCSQQEIENACATIRRLDPHPGWQFSRPISVWITPDVIVRQLEGEWGAVLNPQALPNICLNKMYADLFKQHSSRSHHSLSSHLQEARWTLRNIQQRFNTILRVAQTIVAEQQLFFMHGPLAMQPLALKDVANALGLHESTVSRAITHKYMATPAGVFELKYFFSRGLTTQRGGTCSTTAIRSAIRKMIEAEKGDAPLSDVQITRVLTQGGVQVARRTVTKYRQMMRIPAAEQRHTRKLDS